MPLPYKLLYALNLRPWEGGEDSPKLAELLEGEGALTPGKALDIGCGTGRHVRMLAERGWEVTAFDFEPKAIAAATAATEDCLPKPVLFVGDATKIGRMDIAGPFSLVLDIGCLFSFSEEVQRQAQADLLPLTTADAVMVRFGVLPAHRIAAIAHPPWKVEWASEPEKSLLNPGGKYPMWCLLSRNGPGEREG